ncbi:MAG: GNAT family N-acetyltransferase [Planctomycetia bacterium]|nr:GNAT family N-acetyltransferase [Planctomycetia bacterium]
MLRLRRATLSDAATLASLRRFVHEPHVAAEPRVYAALDVEGGLAAMRERLGGAGVVGIVAEHDGTAAGYVLAQEVRRAATPLTEARSYLLVDELAVAPSARRLGVGRALMAEAEGVAKALGLARIELDVRAWNDGAARFYAALGYAPFATRLARDLGR